MKSMMGSVSRPALETVDFEGMNRIPAPSGLKEERSEIVPGMINVWYEYVPSSWDGKSEVPLVVQVHGGGNDGRRWADYTVWHLLAEKEGFIVIYPNSPGYGAWRCDDTDVQYLYDLIERMCVKYRIDRTRIYMQGMSNGDMMTLAFSMKHPEVLAAAGYITGPTAEELLDGDRPAGPLPILQMRGELDVNWHLTPETKDVYAVRYGMNDLNREIWKEVNGVDGQVPRIAIRGKDNFMVFPGKMAPIINWEIKGMGHREPTSGAQELWDRLYSGCRRVNGKLVMESPRMEITGDPDLILLALGSRMAWTGNRLVEISSLSTGVVRVMLPAQGRHFCPVELGEMAETEVHCVPAEFFRNVFGAEMTCTDAGDTVRLVFPDGKDVLLRSKSMLVEINGRYEEMQKPCILLGGALYVPVAELCRMLLGSFVTVSNDVICIAGHYAELGRYTARLVCSLLGGKARE